jgi:NADH:ubiquinone oxidoreductase subunit 5 (subunit L)/multisubunit Na+/H+ antiporter MnhA subunit
VLMPLAVIGQAALSSWLVARVGDVSILIAIVQVAVASAFWQMINDSPEESRFQPLGVILPMLLLFGVVAALTIDIQSSFLPVVTWRGFIGR